MLRPSSGTSAPPTSQRRRPTSACCVACDTPVRTSFPVPCCITSSHPTGACSRPTMFCKRRINAVEMEYSQHAPERNHRSPPPQHKLTLEGPVTCAQFRLHNNHTQARVVTAAAENSHFEAPRPLCLRACADLCQCFVGQHRVQPVEQQCAHVPTGILASCKLQRSDVVAVGDPCA